LILFEMNLQGLRATREMYLTPAVKTVICTDLRSWKSEWDTSETPFRQFSSLMDRYLTGERLNFEESMHVMNPVADGIWELITADLRIFGWFYRKNVFIATAINLARVIKTHNLYAGYKGEALRFRENVKLAPPKCVPGGNINDVV
jgi:hypothetical protein